MESLIAYALRNAKKYYNREIYEHAARVAGYVAENAMIPDDKMDACIALALMHNLKEGTDWSGGGFDDYYRECMSLLSRPGGMDYTEYLKRIRENSGTHPETYWVKMADIKDHLMQPRTFAGEADKYTEALAYLL